MSGAKKSAEPAGPVTIRLRYPIRAEGDDGPVISEIRIRPVKGKDFRALPPGGNERTLALMGRMSGQPSHVIDELQGDDFHEATEVIERFLERSPPTGDEQPPQ